MFFIFYYTFHRFKIFVFCVPTTRHLIKKLKSVLIGVMLIVSLQHCTMVVTTLICIVLVRPLKVNEHLLLKKMSRCSICRELKQVWIISLHNCFSLNSIDLFFFRISKVMPGVASSTLLTRTIRTICNTTHRNSIQFNHHDQQQRSRLQHNSTLLSVPLLFVRLLSKLA